MSKQRVFRGLNYFLAVSGVLLMDNTSEKEVYVSDCVPLFHQVSITKSARILIFLLLKKTQLIN